jgi:hypothetical protein
LVAELVSMQKERAARKQKRQMNVSYRLRLNVVFITIMIFPCAGRC